MDMLSLRPTFLAYTFIKKIVFAVLEHQLAQLDIVSLFLLRSYWISASALFCRLFIKNQSSLSISSEHHSLSTNFAAVSHLQSSMDVHVRLSAPLAGRQSETGLFFTPT